MALIALCAIAFVSCGIIASIAEHFDVGDDCSGDALDRFLDNNDL